VTNAQHTHIFSFLLQQSKHFETHFNVSHSTLKAMKFCSMSTSEAIKLGKDKGKVVPVLN